MCLPHAHSTSEGARSRLPAGPSRALICSERSRRLGGRAAQAEEAYRHAVGLAPSWPIAHFNLANSLKDQGRADEAVEEYEATLALDPPFKPAVYNNMALAHGAANRNDDVLRCYELALEENPDFPETHNNIASVRRRPAQRRRPAPLTRRAERSTTPRWGAWRRPSGTSARRCGCGVTRASS
jgi:tetratricopeptide (TPR) repeat protein